MRRDNRQHLPARQTLGATAVESGFRNGHRTKLPDIRLDLLEVVMRHTLFYTQILPYKGINGKRPVTRSLVRTVILSALARSSNKRYDLHRTGILQMSGVNDMASVLGIPAGAATLAVAMYGACVGAEKAARKDRLEEFSIVLQSTSWRRTTALALIVKRIFELTFGERHFSRQCVKRSIAISIGDPQN